MFWRAKHINTLTNVYCIRFPGPIFDFVEYSNVIKPDRKSRREMRRQVKVAPQYS